MCIERAVRDIKIGIEWGRSDRYNPSKLKHHPSDSLFKGNLEEFPIKILPGGYLQLKPIRISDQSDRCMFEWVLRGYGTPLFFEDRRADTSTLQGKKYA